jgi:hypothetical protein
VVSRRQAVKGKKFSFRQNKLTGIWSLTRSAPWQKPSITSQWCSDGLSVLSDSAWHCRGWQWRSCCCWLHLLHNVHCWCFCIKFRSGILSLTDSLCCISLLLLAPWHSVHAYNFLILVSLYSLGFCQFTDLVWSHFEHNTIVTLHWIHSVICLVQSAFDGISNMCMWSIACQPVLLPHLVQMLHTWN